MPPLQPLALAWSQDARPDCELRTPEPMAEGDAQPPSPPRPRFRVKRRNASNLNAPTQQFLASVAAADIPIPSIEEPRVLDEEMPDNMYPMAQLSDIDDMPLTPHGARIFSPPKTPAPGAEPGVVPSLSPKHYPSWSIDSTLSSLESSPDYESSRPSTSHSTHTSASLLSYFSVSSEELNRCVSPEVDDSDLAGEFPLAEDTQKTIKAQPISAARGKRRAPWTNAMSQHLWSTYMMYLQDPKVTPFRLGKSGIPPHGVTLRVSREAKRSWKGSRAGSGSTTPTGQLAGTFVQWPHTCAATRAHLRELCKANARTTARNHQYMANSPTPFGKAATRFWNRRCAPARSPSVFSGQDMVMSLAVSTSESMHPQGPLAQLTGSKPEPEELPPPQPYTEAFPSLPGYEPLESERNQLASPFTSRSYGPSSSSSLPSSFVIDSDLRRRGNTTGPHRGLKSPVRLTRSRSTVKRRSKQPLLEPPRRIKRPSLGSDLWIDPSSTTTSTTAATIEGPSTAPQLPKFSSSFDDREKLFVPRTNLQELFEASRTGPIAQSATLAPPAEAPARLGSPFSLGNSSHSLPSRHTHSSSIDIGTIRRPYNTFQQSGEAGPVTRASLTARLAYIDERLKDFRSRPRRRSESPL